MSGVPQLTLLDAGPLAAVAGAPPAAAWSAAGKPTGVLELPAPPGWPEPPGPTAFGGLAGELVEAIAPHTEADRATRGRTLRVNYADWRIDDVMLRA